MNSQLGSQLGSAGHITARRFGRRLLTKSIQTELSKEFEFERYSDAYVFRAETAVAVCFPSGIVVNWGSSAVVSRIAEMATHFFEDVYDIRYEQEYNYKHQDAEGFVIADDGFNIKTTDEVAIVTLSHAIARSVQLEYNEALVEAVFERVADLPVRLKTAGKIDLSAHNIKRLIGLVVEAQYSLSTFGLADDRPEVLWENPVYEKDYRTVAAYLELHDRWSVLTEKIAVLESTLEILRDEINTKRSHLLEWIIIGLFLIDIVYIVYEVGLLHFLFK